MQPNILALQQSIPDMNWSVMQVLSAQQAANTQLQVYTQHNQASQLAYTDLLRTLTESIQ